MVAFETAEIVRSGLRIVELAVTRDKNNVSNQRLRVAANVGVEGEEVRCIVRAYMVMLED